MDEKTCAEHCVFCGKEKSPGCGASFFWCKDTNNSHNEHLFTKRHLICQEAIDNPDAYLTSIRS